MTFIDVLTLVFLVSVLFCLILILVALRYRDIRYSNPEYLDNKIRYKKQLLSILIERAEIEPFDLNTDLEIKDLTLEIEELYEYLNKAQLKQA